MVETKHSTDFAMGRPAPRPKLKSEEFFVSTILVTEIVANLCLKPPKSAILIGSTARNRFIVMRALLMFNGPETRADTLTHHCP
eukprot:2430865-Prymnesium_polylepis.1